MSNIRWSLLVGFAVLAAGCVETDAPLSDPAAAGPDETLYGHWVARQVEDGKTVLFHAFIGKHSTKGDPPGLMQIEMIAWSPDEKKVERDEFRYVTSTKIGKSAYLNLIAAPASFQETGAYAKWAKEENRKIGLVRYKCDGKTLQTWLGDSSMESQKKFKSLVKAGELTKNGDTDGAESLAKYLEKNGGEDLFDEAFLTFTKSP